MRPQNGNSPIEADSAAAPAPRGTSRRTLVTAGTVTAATFLLSGTPAALAAPRAGAGATTTPASRASSAFAAFTAVPASTGDRVTVPPGFRAEPLARWGDPLAATARTGQVGTHHHGVHFHPLTPAGRQGLLVLAHEKADPAAGAADAMATQGVTVIAVSEGPDGSWRTKGSRYNRRLASDTPVRLSGPAARAAAGTADRSARGVLAPGATGVTPWGTVLIAEENANAFFGTASATWERDEEAQRYGLAAGGFGRPWHAADARFDLAADEARPEAFGWIVELDPEDPGSAPVKRTALGRFWHGAAAVTETPDGRVVVYSTDAEDGEYLYRFVSASPWRTAAARGDSPLDEGSLAVARLSQDGKGGWIPLVFGEGPLTAANGWRDQADVLLRARLAADAVGATGLARPEGVAVDPRSGDVYLALAGSLGAGGCEHRAEDAGSAAQASHRGTARYGQVLRWSESGGGAGSSFRWEEFLTGGAAEPGDDGLFAAPKGLWFSADGQLWISTGVAGQDLGGSDPVFREAGNNALLTADPRTRVVRRFLTAPRGAEVTGVSGFADGSTLFVNIQHPGQRTAENAPSDGNPRAVSNWPDHEPDGVPRSGTIAVQPATR